MNNELPVGFEKIFQKKNQNVIKNLEAAPKNNSTFFILHSTLSPEIKM